MMIIWERLEVKYRDDDVGKKKYLVSAAVPNY